MTAARSTERRNSARLRRVSEQAPISVRLVKRSATLRTLELTTPERRHVLVLESAPKLLLRLDGERIARGSPPYQIEVDGLQLSLTAELAAAGRRITALSLELDGQSIYQERPAWRPPGEMWMLLGFPVLIVVLVLTEAPTMWVISGLVLGAAVLAVLERRR